MKDRRSSLLPRWPALLALLLALSLSPALGRDLEKEKEKAKGPNLVGIVVTTATHQNPGGQPYDPLEGVEITLQGTQHRAVTDALGMFRFQDLPPGSYTVVAMKQGIGMSTRTVQVTRGPNPAMVNLVLTPGSSQFAPADGLPMGGMGGGGSAPGTVYVAFAQKMQAGAAGGHGGHGGAAGHGVPGGPAINTQHMFRNMILHGGDPFGPGSGPPQMALPGSVNPGAYHTPTNVAANNLMLLPADNPSQTGYKALDTQPYWVAFNVSGSRLYVSTAAQTIQVLDTQHDNTLLHSVPAGGIVTDLRLSPDGNLLLASVLGASPGVLILDTRSHAPIRSIPTPMMRSGDVGQPRAAAANREGTRFFVLVGTPLAGELVAVDAFTGVPAASLPVGANPTGMDLSPDGRFLYVVNSGSGDLSVIDAWTFTELGRVRVGVSPQRVAVSPDGSRVFVTNKGSDSVSVLNGMTQSPVATVPVGKQPVGVAVSPDGSRAFVTCTGASSVTILDARSGGVLMTTTPLPQSTPWGVAVKP